MIWEGKIMNPESSAQVAVQDSWAWPELGGMETRRAGGGWRAWDWMRERVRRQSF